jgi:hypothetical protein
MSWSVPAFKPWNCSPSERAFTRISRNRLGIRIVRVDEHSANGNEISAPALGLLHPPVTRRSWGVLAWAGEARNVSLLVASGVNSEEYPP